jgi:hypothetical protein
MTIEKQTNQQQLDQIGEKLYQQYAKPLEKEHAGKYVAVSQEGKVVLAPTLDEVLEHSLAELGEGSFVFKLGGDGAVGKWR